MPTLRSIPALLVLLLVGSCLLLLACTRSGTDRATMETSGSLETPIVASTSISTSRPVETPAPAPTSIAKARPVEPPTPSPAHTPTETPPQATLTPDSNTPIIVGEDYEPDLKFAVVSAGGSNTCGIREDGTLTCWGSNWWGESLPPLGQFRALSASDEFSCGIRDDGTVECWGRDIAGETTPPSWQVHLNQRRGASCLRNKIRRSYCLLGIGQRLL